MGDLVSADRLLEKQIKADARRELNHLYHITAGWTDPEPPTEEQVRQMAEGIIEL